MDFDYHLEPWAYKLHTAITTCALVLFVPSIYYAHQIKHVLIYLTVRDHMNIMHLYDHH